MGGGWDGQNLAVTLVLSHENTLWCDGCLSGLQVHIWLLWEDANWARGRISSLDAEHHQRGSACALPDTKEKVSCFFPLACLPLHVGGHGIKAGGAMARSLTTVVGTCPGHFWPCKWHSRCFEERFESARCASALAFCVVLQGSGALSAWVESVSAAVLVCVQ